MSSILQRKKVALFISSPLTSLYDAGQEIFFLINPRDFFGLDLTDNQLQTPEGQDEFVGRIKVVIAHEVVGHGAHRNQIFAARVYLPNVAAAGAAAYAVTPLVSALRNKRSDITKFALMKQMLAPARLGKAAGILALGKILEHAYMSYEERYADEAAIERVAQCHTPEEAAAEFESLARWCDAHSRCYADAVSDLIVGTIKETYPAMPEDGQRLVQNFMQRHLTTYLAIVSEHPTPASRTKRFRDAAAAVRAGRPVIEALQPMDAAAMLSLD